MIKRFWLVLAVAAMMAAMVVAPGVAGAQDNASQLCKENNDFGLGSHGDCVSFFRSSSFAAEVCKDPAIQEQLEAKNHGQCVKTVNQFKNSLF